MSKYITEDDIPLGYSSEVDEYESEHVQDLLLAAEPFEIYVGNTGKVSFEKFFSLFKPHGIIRDMSFWRTHDHLYHCRIAYRSKDQSDKAIKLMNNRKVFSKRIRVTYAKDRVDLDFAAAIRIDDISADVTEEDIFDHFLSCGDIRFVIKTGFAAYIQFAASPSAAKALGLEMILNGDPYTLTRIAADDRIDHIQVIENMKDIKYRKPFVMVENYPELPKGTPLCRYKSNFESVGPVRHFKIAPTGNGTVTLALCMDKADDRDLVIDRFNDATISDKRLKLYMAPGKARMTVKHVTKYAICKNSIMIEAIRPYYKEYDVCMLFRKCGSISFVEKVGTRWIICFDNPSAVSLARSFHVFSLYKKVLVIKELNQDTYQAGKDEILADPDAHKKPPEEKKKPNKSKPGHIDDYLKQIARKMDENIKQNLIQITKAVPLVPASKQQNLANQAKQIDALFKTRESLMDVKATPVVQPKPSTSLPNKRPANDNGSDASPARARKDSTNDINPLVEESNVSNYKFQLAMSNLPKGIEENDLRELFRDYEIKRVALFCSKDLYHPTSIGYIQLTSKQDTKAVLLHHHDMYRGKRVCIHHAQQSYSEFLPEKSIMLKNLPKNVTEEGITEELEKLLGLQVVDVIKPAHHYAYVDFTEGIHIDKKLLNSLRNALTRFKIDVFPLYCKQLKLWMGSRSYDIRQIDRMRALCGAVIQIGESDADKHFGVHNAHKLFVGNIPRDTEAEDVIDFFNNFGSVIDYTPIEKKSCYLRKSAILSFMNSKHAQNAYRQQPHSLEGSWLDVHLMDCPPVHFAADTHFKLLTVKFHSPFLTNDEIRYHLQKIVSINHSIRFDAFDDRANFVANYKLSRRTELIEGSIFDIQYINDEAVKIVKGYDPTPPTEDEAREKKNISNSPHRQQKEKYLSFAVYKENLKEDMEVRSRPSKEADIPFKSFYNDNSVQINNVSLDTTLEDIRDLFIKCGDIVDYRALLLDEDATKICYVKFKIDLAADLACTYSQRMVNGKRILVHLAKETLHAERDRSLLVERLSPSTTAEQLYDAFTPIGTVKYVQKQSPFSAIVCFKDKDCILEAVNVTTIPNSGSFIVNPCYEEYDPRLFNNFSCQEEFIPIERMRAALKPRILPEFHQLELDRQVFETLPDDIKTRLINEVFLAREQLPNFNELPKHQQINALKTNYPDFTQKEHFLRLTAREQEKLLDVTSNLQQDYPYEEVKDLEVLPPAPKQTRTEEPIYKKPDKVFAANWYSSPSEEAEPTPDPYPSDMEPLQRIEPLVSAMNASHPGQTLQKIQPLVNAMNASHVAQALPSSGLLGFPGNNGPPHQMGPRPGNMFPQGGGPRFPNMYPQQGPPQFAGGMPPFGGPNQHPMMGPGPRPMMRPPMGMGSPMGGMPHMGGMPSGGGGPQDSRWMQQRMAAMAYNVGPGPRGPMDFGGFDRPPYFN